ncbi:hypothetical protein [Streptomyces sp. B6B3]
MRIRMAIATLSFAALGAFGFAGTAHATDEGEHEVIICATHSACIIED